ncbi:DNA-binding transcriptional regulator BolA-like isoform X2 [Macrosteles quadrilineatus]|uniref:DNA-binding transcriptional regulator BolA-like isoform X2 n=1 Tax=Macrosteles quadrilineatus TaxID=74068 RepID=UPI0023E259EE|nr:DNA-binding transcriptional regulator BolA-like isoform X2 [Macrosteles quadrilineatus]
MACALMFVYLLVLGWIYANPTTTSREGSGPVETIIRQKLTEQLKPIHLEVINESFKHGAPPGTEAHFRVKVVSPLFTDMPLLKRHQTVNEILKNELESSVHALTLYARSPQQWDEERGITPPPACQGDGIAA